MWSDEEWSGPREPFPRVQPIKNPGIIQSWKSMTMNESYTTPNPHGGDAGTVAKQLGLQRCPEIELDFSVNVNPLGPPPQVRRILLDGVRTVTHYPQTDAFAVTEALANDHGVSAEQVVVGNGSTDLFGMILRAFRPAKACGLAPCYAGYREVCTAHQVEYEDQVASTLENNFQLPEPEVASPPADLVFLTNPNNPVGNRILSRTRLLERISGNPACIFVVDESFMDFSPVAEKETLVCSDLPENLVVVKSLTKFFAIPGLRLGMLCAHSKTVARIARTRLPWSVNGLAQKVGSQLYKNKDYIAKSRAQTIALRKHLQQGLEDIPGFQCFPSESNFLLVKLPSDWSGSRLQKALLKRGVLIRSCANFPGLGDTFCRLAVRPPAETDKLLKHLNDLIRLSPKAQTKKRVQKAPALMVVGTTSNAGKSIIAAGICRILARRGVSVAPFKAQNMALNSFVTEGGGEMGRAQVVQAQAAGVRPHTDMNPVLIKPMGDNGSQVIVNGRAIGNFQARDYYARKEEVSKAARSAYDRLAAQYDAVVLEGAGSPAEINLMEEDFVNMNMAHYASARTILVADIDRGGVFASIYGTIALLPEHHRKLLAGVLINKFRGDPTLLDSGIRQIEEFTGVPVLGVLPYLTDMQIEEEDSLGLEQKQDSGEAVIDVAVVRLPRISNFTDFLAMEKDTGVRVRYAESPEQIGRPDLIILPGTKNTRSDLEWLHEHGFFAVLHDARKNGVQLYGICGGYQMLGETVSDPGAVEGDKGTSRGLGLLPLKTVLAPQKILAQVRGKLTGALPFVNAPIEFCGYEIHAGETIQTSAGTAGVETAIIIDRRGQTNTDEAAGCVSADGMVAGCYVHGLFDLPEVRQALWQWLCERRGVDMSKIKTTNGSPQRCFDHLADNLEKHVSKVIENIFG